MITGACAASYDYYENGAALVAIAAFMTLAITIALTIYAVKTKNDMTKFGIYKY
jgi:FtsH-binding integral membrane protein